MTDTVPHGYTRGEVGHWLNAGKEELRATLDVKRRAAQASQQQADGYIEQIGKIEAALWYLEHPEPPREPSWGVWEVRPNRPGHDFYKFRGVPFVVMAVLNGVGAKGWRPNWLDSNQRTLFSWTSLVAEIRNAGGAELVALLPWTPGESVSAEPLQIVIR